MLLLRVRAISQMVERMPLAYVHVVHVMIDLLLVLSPLALYPKVGALTVPLCGILTLFYRGLLELSKSFLDPFGNEGSCAQNIQSDVLITEINRGSAGWERGGAALPFDVVEPFPAGKQGVVTPVDAAQRQSAS